MKISPISQSFTGSYLEKFHEKTRNSADMTDTLLSRERYSRVIWELWQAQPLYHWQISRKTDLFSKP